MRGRIPKSKINVLVVENDRKFIDFLNRMLKGSNFRVKELQNPNKLIEELHGDRYQIIFVAEVLEGISGIDILKELHKEETDICVIVTSEKQTLETSLEALRNGAFDYLRKPISEEMLEEVLARAKSSKGLVVDFEKKINMEIGRKIRDLRKDRRLTLKQLGNRTGLSISLISQIERAKSSSSVSTLYKISTALNVKLEYFFNGL